MSRTQELRKPSKGRVALLVAVLVALAGGVWWVWPAEDRPPSEQNQSRIDVSDADTQGQPVSSLPRVPGVSSIPLTESRSPSPDEVDEIAELMSAEAVGSGDGALEGDADLEITAVPGSGSDSAPHLAGAIAAHERADAESAQQLQGELEDASQADLETHDSDLAAELDASAQAQTEELNELFDQLLSETSP